MIPDDQIADPADHDPQREPDRRRVHRLQESELVPAHEWIGEDHGAENPADEADPAPVNREGIAYGLQAGLAEVCNDIEEPRPDDRPDQGPEDHRPRLVLEMPRFLPSKIRT